jgi:predicted DCC family thiol-disulfide oxidoreductase YuxK
MAARVSGWDERRWGTEAWLRYHQPMSDAATTKQDAGGQAVAGNPDRPVVLYDDSCRFCRAMAEVAMHWDREERLGFLPWNDPLAAAWLEGLDPAIRDASMHFKMPSGKLLSGRKTFALLLSYLPGAGWLGRMGRRYRGPSWILSTIYGLVAGNREPLSPLVPYRALVYRQPRIQ